MEGWDEDFLKFLNIILIAFFVLLVFDVIRGDVTRRGTFNIAKKEITTKPLIYSGEWNNSQSLVASAYNPWSD